MSLQKTIKTLPNKPGVYIFKDRAGNILYVGKAKSIKARVNQYFQKSAVLEFGKDKMVLIVKSIDHIITDSELEALILEATLIKQHKPKYNIRLKDDKYYKLIKIDYSTPFPKIYSTREPKLKTTKTQNPASLFGPFTDGTAVNETLEFLRNTFKFRNCNREIPVNPNEAKKKNKSPCLDFHIQLCTAPCVGNVSQKEYLEQIKNVEEFLKGKQKELTKNLKIKMKQASNLLDFETATKLRDQILNLEKIQENQKMFSVKGENQDIITISKNRVLLLAIRNGKLLNRERYKIESRENAKNNLSSFLEQYYVKINSLPREIIIPFKINTTILKKFFENKNNVKIKITIPKKVNKKKLLRLAESNLKEWIRQSENDLWQTTVANTKQSTINQLKALQKVLKSNKLPKRIEAYDISNIQGKFATGSLVVLENGKINKSEYKKFKIIRDGDPDDVAMMSEMLIRRLNHSKYGKQKKDQWKTPDLILLDGGKGQLNAIFKIFSKSKVPWKLAAIAKREEEIYLPQRKNPIKLKKYPNTLKLIQLIRDEAHRFAITYHRKLRRKSLLK